MILSSDNGPIEDDGYEFITPLDRRGHRPAAPSGGAKYSILEAARRPLLVRLAGRVKPGASAALVSQVLHLAASLAALAGVAVPELRRARRTA